MDERAFAAATRTCNHVHTTQRNIEVDVAKVVGFCASQVSSTLYALNVERAEPESFACCSSTDQSRSGSCATTVWQFLDRPDVRRCVPEPGPKSQI